MNPTLLHNNQFNPIGFYTDIKMQNHRRYYSWNNLWPVSVSYIFFTPFQLILPPTLFRYEIAKCEIYNLAGDYLDITESMINAGLQVKEFTSPDYHILFFPGTNAINNFPENINGNNICYLKISFPEDITGTFFSIYSDIFILSTTYKTNYLKIEWWDERDLYFTNGRIVYVDDNKNNIFKFQILLNADLGKPEYTVEEKGTQRDGYFFPEQQISEKHFKTNILATETVCDAIRLIGLSDNIKITDKYGNIYFCDSFMITPQWQTQGDLASVTIEFDTDTIVKKVGRGFYPKVMTAPPAPGTPPPVVGYCTRWNKLQT